MLKTIMTYFYPIYLNISKMIAYKNGAMFISSITLSAILELISKFVDSTFLGVGSTFLVLISMLFLVDFWCGIVASLHEHKISVLKGNELKEKKLSSSKITLTFLKFIVLFFWMWIAAEINNIFKNSTFLSDIISTITIVPLVLIALREFVSIGENIERRYGIKPYIFTLIEKMFDIIQLKFLEKFKESGNNNGSYYGTTDNYNNINKDEDSIN